MTNSWDDGYGDDVDHGHRFADRYLSDELRGSLYGMHRSEDDRSFDEDCADLNFSPGAQGRARRIAPGMIEAKFPGTCTGCPQPIYVNDPIVKDGPSWRHAGCGHPQAERTRSF